MAGALACLQPPSLFLLPGPLPPSAPFLPQRRPGAPLPPQHAQPAPAPLQPQGAPSPPPPLRPLRTPPFTLQPPSPCAFPLPRSALPCSMPAGLLAGIAAGTAPCCRQAVHTAPPAEAFLHPLPSSPAPPRSYSHPPSLAAGTPLRALSTTRKGARVLMARSIQGARSAAAGCSSALHSLSQRSRGLKKYITIHYILHCITASYPGAPASFRTQSLLARSTAASCTTAAGRRCCACALYEFRGFLKGKKKNPRSRSSAWSQSVTQPAPRLRAFNS